MSSTPRRSSPRFNTVCFGCGDRIRHKGTTLFCEVCVQHGAYGRDWARRRHQVLSTEEKLRIVVKLVHKNGGDRVLDKSSREALIPCVPRP